MNTEEEETTVEVETPVVETPVAPGPETTPLVAGDGAITLESLHALVLELQGTVANLQAVQDQAIPVEPAAAEEEAPPADDSGLLEEDTPGDAPEEENLEELDALLSAN